MIKEYITIHNQFQLDFDREVNAHLRAGWELYGFQSTHVTTGSARSTIIFVQVMVKCEEEQ